MLICRRLSWLLVLRVRRRIISFLLHTSKNTWIEKVLIPMNAWIPWYNVPFKSFNQVFVVTRSIKFWNFPITNFLGYFLSLEVKIIQAYKDITLWTYSLLAIYSNIFWFTSVEATRRYQALTQLSQHHKGQQNQCVHTLHSTESPNTCGCFHHNSTMFVGAAHSDKTPTELITYHGWLAGWLVGWLF